MTVVPEYLDPDKWAAALGLIETSDPSLHSQSERDREGLFNRRFYVPTHWHLRSSPQAAIEHKAFCAHFSAKYLPMLVDRFIELPSRGNNIGLQGANDYPLENIYHVAFKFADPPYIAKYMISTNAVAEGGRRLPQVIAERLIGVASELERLKNASAPSSELNKYELGISRALTTLMMLLFATKKKTISAITSAELIGWLDKWKSRTWLTQPGPSGIASSSFLISNLLQSGNVMSAEVQRQRRHALKGTDICALPSCESKTVQGRCAKCKTVVYCSPEHQRTHWKFSEENHKQRCFPTTY